MKRIGLTALAMLIAAMSFGQTNANQIKKKSDGSAVADTNSALKVSVFRSTTAPVAPLSAGDIWCDTTTTPCILKTYSGSVWNASVTVATMAVLTDYSGGFPASPSDGQMVFVKINNMSWIYNGTTTLWCNTLGTCTSNNITDNFTGSSITAPITGMTITDGGAGGTATGGSISCKVTFATSTGGETTPSPVTSNVTLTASHAITFSSVPTGGTGTTARRLYCSPGGTPTGPWSWWGTIADNSTTSATINGVANASYATRAPNRDYSAPLNGRWAVSNNTAATTSGGCGSTGTSMICRSSNSKTASSTTTADVNIIASTSISSYNSGNYTIQYRIVNCENGFGVNGFLTGNCSAGALYAGTAFSSGPIKYELAGSNTIAGPLSGTNVWDSATINRVTIGAGGSAVGGLNAFPRTSSFPFWVRFVKNGAIHNSYISKDALNWVPQTTTGTAALNPGDSGLGIVPGTLFDTWGFPVDVGNAGTAGDSVVEFDNWTLVVN